MSVQQADRRTAQVGFLLMQPQSDNAVVAVAPALSETTDVRAALARVELAADVCHRSLANRGERSSKPDPLRSTGWSIAANWLSFGIIGIGASLAVESDAGLLAGVFGPAAVFLGRCLENPFYRAFLKDREAKAKPLEQLPAPVQPVESALVAAIAERALTQMTERKISGFAAGQRLREAVAHGQAVDPATRAIADNISAIFDCFVDERGKRAPVVTETQALAAAFAFESLPPELQAQLRPLIDERLLATKHAPRMSGDVWRLLYETTRARPPAPERDSGGKQ